MDSNSQDRNLPASERKLQKAREDGQVTRSRDLSHLAVLGVGALGLMTLAPLMLERFKMDLSHQLSFDAARSLGSNHTRGRLITIRMKFFSRHLSSRMAAFSLSKSLAS